MINWDEFEHIHVIKKLKQILSSWWNIDIVFTDERGHLRGMDPKSNRLSNPAVSAFLSKARRSGCVSIRYLIQLL